MGPALMARNTGRGSRSASVKRVADSVWLDSGSKDWVVWSESEGVVVYEGEKEVATRRTLLTPGQAETLASLLNVAARDARRLAE
jgi:hypothetical protein